MHPAEFLYGRKELPTCERRLTMLPFFFFWDWTSQLWLVLCQVTPHLQSLFGFFQHEALVNPSHKSAEDSTVTKEARWPLWCPHAASATPLWSKTNRTNFVQNKRERLTFRWNHSHRCWISTPVFFCEGYFRFLAESVIQHVEPFICCFTSDRSFSPMRPEHSSIIYEFCWILEIFRGSWQMITLLKLWSTLVSLGIQSCLVYV